MGLIKHLIGTKTLITMNTNKFDYRELENLKEVLSLEDASATSSNFTETLEQKSAALFGSRYCVAQNSGTSTMHSALLACGITHGDEVLSPAFTVIMNTAVTLQCGAIPVYVDVDPETFCIDINDLKRKITPRTKALMVVSVYGQSPEYDQIVQICNENEIILIEDNAETVFGYYKDKLVGTFGDFSSMSLEDSKHLSCGEGGLLLGNDESLMEKARKFAGHGFQTLRAETGKIRLNPTIWQSPTFERHVEIGYNYRLTEFQSAIALAQLEKVEFLVNWRKKSGQAITEVLNNSRLFSIQKTPAHIEHSFWCVGAKFEGDINDWFKFRDTLYELCGERVFGAWQVPYNEPVMKSGAYKRYLAKEFKERVTSIGTCPNAEEIQKKMMVFKTKYRNDEALNNLLNGLRKTIQIFER
jgi:perosamine synthetase